MALGKFINQLETQVLGPKISKRIVDDIEKGVNEFVRRLTDEVEKRDHFFKVKRILNVGSFYEGTKIGNPDEFDFLIELDGQFKLEKGCSENPCSAHVTLLGNDHSPDIEKKIGKHGYLRSLQTFNFWRDEAEKVLFDSLNGQNKLNFLACEMGTLRINQYFHGSGPNAEMHLVWESYEKSGEKRIMVPISIDMSICIPSTDELLAVWQEHLTPLDMTRESRPVLVVPALSRIHNCKISEYRGPRYDYACWKISLTPAEVVIMRNIPETYTRGYRFLKWICKLKGSTSPYTLNGIESLKCLSSFMLKNAVLVQNKRLQTPGSCLDRVSHPAACDGDEEVISVIYEVLQYLTDCAENNFLPGYLLPRANLWRSNKAGDVKPPLRILALLKKFLFKELNEDSGATFDFKAVKSRVSSLQEQFMRLESNDLYGWFPDKP